MVVAQVEEPSIQLSVYLAIYESVRPSNQCFPRSYGEELFCDWLQEVFLAQLLKSKQTQKREQMVSICSAWQQPPVFNHFQQSKRGREKETSSHICTYAEYLE